jgi:pimeloyl-ACP methyl ester carboxylesterase
MPLRNATKFAAATLVALTAIVPVAGARPRTGPPIRPARCIDHANEAMPFTVVVEGQKATGHYSVPDSRPTALVVIDHGYGHSSYSWIEHMKRMSEELDVVAVAMDYRGTTFQEQPWPKDGVPSTRGWRVMEGAEDSIAAAKLLQTTCSSIEETVIFGVSMGGNTSGLALALAAEEKQGNDPLFDYWIDAEGAVNVTGTYFGARALAAGNEFAKNAHEDIVQEMGGVEFEENPEPYLEHSVVSRIEEIEASGVKGVVIIHGANDGLVPINQSRELVSELVDQEIPVDMYTALRNGPEGESGTTATGYAGGTDPGIAGHASERSTTHAVMTTAFDRLKAIILDDYAPGPYREFVFDDGEIYTAP